MYQQIIDLAREFNRPLTRAAMGDVEKVAGAFCMFLLIVYFALRDAILFITCPLWILPYVIWRKENGRKENR